MQRKREEIQEININIYTLLTVISKARQKNCGLASKEIQIDNIIIKKKKKIEFRKLHSHDF